MRIETIVKRSGFAHHAINEATEEANAILTNHYDSEIASVTTQTILEPATYCGEEAISADSYCHVITIVIRDAPGNGI